MLQRMIVLRSPRRCCSRIELVVEGTRCMDQGTPRSLVQKIVVVASRRGCATTRGQGRSLRAAVLDVPDHCSGDEVLLS